ncbi:uncharacterized protein LOC128749853 [Synchiropus splendidus]|uniref:uncharacterized protein LOC128749853 n=1 Tax=Synchiropus splendidus TaxID=270530 RepID=UPI00237E63D6|nr:uncharacterized protein LOC128749853 [Synchiropus splendidus]XP_053705783.1 uncharacterized protein LOC128749853 [Synchiropus splendidus]XP_053705784.1 uncharacterized protein LOC128749853 [Synchiropus splendidus]
MEVDAGRTSPPAASSGGISCRDQDRTLGSAVMTNREANVDSNDDSTAYPDVVVILSDDEHDVMAVDELLKRVKLERDLEPKAEGRPMSEKETKQVGKRKILLGRFFKKYGKRPDGDAPGALEDDMDDVRRVCSTTPYGVYLFTGLELDAGQSISIVLVGYYDQSLDAGAVRLLDSLQMSVDTNHHVSANANRDNTQSDVTLLLESLQRFKLPLSKLSVFYSNASNPEVFVASLKAFNPSLMSLCGLKDLTRRACQTWIAGPFSCVADLISAIYHYYSISPSASAMLRGLFSAADTSQPSLPVAGQHLLTIQTVQRMLTCWGELVMFFKSVEKSQAASWISAQLMDAKVKLKFLFLSNTLQPLLELQQSKRSDLWAELQLISALLTSYAAVFRPAAMKLLFKTRDMSLFQKKNTLLRPAERHMISFANDPSWETTVETLEMEAKTEFKNDAAAFYKSSLKLLVENIPEQLDDETMWNVSKVLTLLENINEVKLSESGISDLGVRLGLCRPDSPEKQELANDYLALIMHARKLQHRDKVLTWAKILALVRSDSTLHQLLLTILALPSSLDMQSLFDKAFTSAKPVQCFMIKVENGHSTSKVLCAAGSKGERQTNGRVSALGLATAPSFCDNSPAVPEAETIYIVSDDEDKTMDSSAAAPQDDGDVSSDMGALVWGELEGFPRWPAITIPSDDGEDPEMTMVEWFGQKMFSSVATQSLKPFGSFNLSFCPKSFVTLQSYQEATLSSLREAAGRCKKQFKAKSHDGESLAQEMLDWAFGGFLPTGPDGFKPRELQKGGTKSQSRSRVKRKLNTFISAGDKTQHDGNPEEPINTQSSSDHLKRSSFKARQVPNEEDDGEEKVVDVPISKCSMKKGQKKHEDDKDTSPDFVPFCKKVGTKVQNNVTNTSDTYLQPDQELRAQIFQRIVDMDLDIEGFCLCCGTKQVEIFHPLFKGSLCHECKENFTQTLYRYDEDGYQSYCTICCYGMEVILCGKESCCRSYCADCLNILAGEGTFDSLKTVDPWICYMCQPHESHRALIPREDWSIRVQEFFANTSAMEFEPHRVYPSIPANLRRPIRVLSLFDGIGTGYLVLKELGFKIEKYVASEICEDSLAVTEVHHDGKITNVGDARFITKEQLQRWGPFDLLIGGSPCNDLSIVNPIRKGLYEGTGRLFFEYYRILHLLKPKEEDPRPFFWLFENVVFMNTQDKISICRFLECNPVLVDAVKVSPAHRARYFWGNIPGMNRPITATQNDKLNLQDCLEGNRQARLEKVRTITTKSNSLKQGKQKLLLPVLHNGREDSLWITELEKIFGFPKHYTDVKNMNRGERQKVLGKAWSVPVIRHLFAPLKDYFACEEMNLSTSTANLSSSSQSSPASSEVFGLR